MHRTELADLIVARLGAEKQRMAHDWQGSGAIRHVVIDDLLPPAAAHEIRAAFPRAETMSIKKSLRELKYVAAQMGRYHALLGEAVYAFQDPRVVQLVGEIKAWVSRKPADDHDQFHVSSFRGRPEQKPRDWCCVPASASCSPWA
ncbi:hypothetical protein [Piscinibacter sp.]|jgi:hypothetical protein|uniref:hypothetical protein n=1 Tax=Piscinibacter sp. TaxID=1903157 RepID=UPI002F41BC7A